MHPRTDVILTVAIGAMAVGAWLQSGPPVYPLVSATQVFSCTLPAAYAAFVAWKDRRPRLNVPIAAALLVWGTCPWWSSHHFIFDAYSHSLTYLDAVKSVDKFMRLLPWLGTHAVICVAQCAALVVLWRPLHRWCGAVVSESALPRQRRLLFGLIACVVLERWIRVAEFLLFMLSDPLPTPQVLRAARALYWAHTSSLLAFVGLVLWAWRVGVNARNAPSGRCSACGYDNAPNAKTCAECGSVT